MALLLHFYVIFGEALVKIILIGFIVFRIRLNTGKDADIII
jgi:hypothetical protein